MSSRIESIKIVDQALVPILRQMTPAQKMAVANRMWVHGRDLMRARVTREHPDWTEEQIQREAAARLSDPEFEEWCYKNIPLADFLPDVQAETHS